MKKVCGLDVHKDSIFCAIYNGEAMWDLLLEMGFEQTPVNPFLIKQLPGMKSDAKDAQVDSGVAVQRYGAQQFCSTTPDTGIAYILRQIQQTATAGNTRSCQHG
ncbi:MAG: IS110 family transposase [Dysgonamonadaceae bacterium]|jgi:hypothetical protein|nr:IS110 family transposase [Dysgonamonadaceae bacterium]